MAVDRESLFSLELVVEKLYIPHVECRFPAVAFRLLDFPTILVEHVEQDLAQNIRRKISLDPYYKVPHQFVDLKDKHGNFMIRKGKSCLFKISTKTLRSHLSNTPLYVMIIDSFPKVPKLLGNCTVPLDEVMDLILKDIQTLGNTVPSVHGDKGLYKIYSLMGKEIGYLILGYRLLSLGPGLIPHIPESAIAKRASEKQKQEHVTPSHVKNVATTSANGNENSLIDTQEMGSMTDPEKRDVLLQTLDTCDKNIHVEMSEPVINTEDKAIEVKELQTISTQTVKKKKKSVPKEAFDLKIEHSDSDDDCLVIANVIQPPPLFYNSNFEPARKTHRVYAYDDDDGDDESSVYTDDLSLENLSDEEVIAQEKEKVLRDKAAVTHQKPALARPLGQYSQYKNLPPQRGSDIPSIQHQNFTAANPQLQNALQNGAIFPMLTALLNELSCLQNPQLVQQTVNQVQSATRVKQQQDQARLNQYQQQQQAQVPPTATKTPKTPTKTVSKTKQVSTPSARREVVIEKMEDDENEKENASYRRRGMKSHRTCAHPHVGVPSQKSWIRKVPEVSVKKSKLTYGMTNTQRLRLAKVNPNWMKSVDKEDIEAKAQRQKLKETVKDDEVFDTGNLSDTLTEVRRLAEKNLQATGGMDDTIQTADTNLNLSQTNSPRIKKHSRRRVSPPWQKKSEGEKDGSFRKKSPRRKRSKSPKGKKSAAKLSRDQPEKYDAADESPYKDSPKDDFDGDDDTPSSRSQKSIQVHIPSAHAYDDDSDDYYNEVMNSKDKKARSGKFAGFMEDNLSLDSIDGDGDEIDGKPGDYSFKEDDDFDLPLESTRNSRPTPLRAAKKRDTEDLYNYNNDSFESDVSPRRDKSEVEESKQNHSTEEYDTRQFQSTDEPELQRLISSGDKSEVSDILSSGTEKSARSPLPLTASMTSSRFKVINPKTSLNSPIPALRRSQVNFGSSVGQPSPTGTPRSPGSSKLPTPRPRKAKDRRADFKLDSIHTESVSSYMPSDSDGNYSDEFHTGNTDDEAAIQRLGLPKIIPSAKLGYTIH